MRFSSSLSAWTCLALPLLTPIASAGRVFQSFALDACQANSSFTASLFNLAVFPDNNTIDINISGETTYTGKIMLRYHAVAYGYEFLTGTLNPCDYTEFSSFCPLSDFAITLDTTYKNISSNTFAQIPGIAYGIPDLDATVKINMFAVDDTKFKNSLACVKTRVSNGKTVYQPAVGWATAVVAGIGLLTSALISGLGHSNAASHIALYALSLFNFFQAIAIFGLTAVPMPPIVQSWTQNFVWSLGIIKVRFLQRLATWYQRGTGGTPSTVLANLDNFSVHVYKRSMDFLQTAPDASSFIKRSASTVITSDYTVHGIARVAFIAGIEITNIFLTGLIFFIIFVLFTVVGVTIFKEICKLAIKAKWMKKDRFVNFREDYVVTLKGIIYRLLLIGYPQMIILCLWEFTQVDSAAEVVLAVIVFFGMSGALGLAAWKVVQIARRSEAGHRTPAYLLYADSHTLDKWGFLYIQFRATAYYYIFVIFAYMLVKGMFVAFAQQNGTIQAVAFVIIEAAALISASVIRPWMDKKTNALGICICVMNFVNAIFLLIMTDVFNGPGLLIGVVSVLFFVFNAVFALVLLIMVLLASIFVLFRKNPESRYQAMADNRSSFIKSQTMLAPNSTNELDELAFTARGGAEGKGGYMDNASPGSSIHRLSTDVPQRQSDLSHIHNYQEPLHSPVNPSMPFLPSHPTGHNSPGFPPPGFAGHPRAASPFTGSDSGRSSNLPSRAGNNASPWQRGAGYDH